MRGGAATAALAAVAALASLAACGASKLPGVEGKSCTEMACANGVNVDFSFRDRGSYVFAVTVDGTTTTCRASIPLPRGAQQPCDRSEVFLGLVGSELPVEQQSIGGLTLPAATNASSITVKATRDGNPIGQKTFVPAYRVSPGPNGPDCEPKECKLATETFP